DPDENRLFSADILKLNRTRVLVRNQCNGMRWNIPYYFINLEGAEVEIRQTKAKVGLTKNETKIGDRVGFYNHRTSTDMYGEIIRRNQKTVTLNTTSNGQWRVSYNSLFPIVDQDQGAIDALPYLQTEEETDLQLQTEDEPLN
ncbi:MAG: hypothetical protein P8104_12950, partial [Gammaproteobacteria bacterium]